MSGKTGSYYQVLGIPRDANLEEIEAAYQKVRQAVAAGKGPRVSSHAVELAYRTLRDPRGRVAYDQTLPGGIYYWEATRVVDLKDIDKIMKEASKPAEDIEIENITVNGAPPLQQRQERRAPLLKEVTSKPQASAKVHYLAGGFTESPEEDYQYTVPYKNRRSNNTPAPGIKNKHQAYSVIEIMEARQRVMNNILLGIGLGAPLLALLGAILFLSLR